MKRALVPLLALGCATELPESTHRLRLAFEPLYLSSFGVARFDVKVSQGPYSSDMAPIFGAVCAPYGTDAPSIGPLEPAKNLVVEVTFYKDELCAEPVLVGARGGIEIIDGGSAGLWHVPVFPIGGFAAFPHVAQSIVEAAPKAECTVDADCRIANPDGTTYQLSAIAECDEKTKRCFVPPTLYPLDMVSPRAYHTATALPDGRVAFVGGVATSDGEGGWIGTGDLVEVFDPGTFTFRRVEIPDLSGQRMAMHATVLGADGSLAVFGGAVQLQIGLTDVGNNRGLSVTVPPGNGLGTDNLLQLASRIDVEAGAANVGALPLPLAGASAAVIGGAVLVTGGVSAQGDDVAATDTALSCILRGGAPQCESAGALSAARFGHCTVCADADCTTGAVVGGESGAVGEIYDGQGFTDLEAAGALSTGVALPTCAGGHLVGGSSAVGGPANVAPLAISVGDGKLTGTEITGLDTVADPFRVGTAATVLADGSLLVTGGVNARGVALATAYRVKDGAVTAVYTMAKARFGHTATLLTAGPLEGAVLVAGGLTTRADGTLDVAAGAELFHP